MPHGRRLATARALTPQPPQVASVEAWAALAAFDRIGASTYADTATELLRSLGDRARSGPRIPGPLTRREREVAELVGRGLSNPGDRPPADPSPRTVGHHVAHVLAKLGLRNRAEVTAQLELIDTYDRGHRSERPRPADQAAPTSRVRLVGAARGRRPPRLQEGGPPGVAAWREWASTRYL